MASFIEKQLPTLAKLLPSKKNGASKSDFVESDSVEPDSRQPSSRDAESAETEPSSAKTTKLQMPSFKRPSFAMPKGPGLSFGGAKKTGNTVGLEIESGSIAATEVSGNGVVGGTAIAQLPPGVVSEGEVQDPDALAEALKDLFARHKLSKNVRLGVANQRVVVRMLRLPLIEKEEELETAIRFQAADHIPMPLEQAVLDFEVITKHASPEGGERYMDVMAVAARRDMVSTLVGSMRKAGLRPIGIDLSAFGMIRALAGDAPPPMEGEVVPTTLFCHFGDVTNLAVARGGKCLFTRVAPFGIEDIATQVAEREGMPLEDARDCLTDVGLEEGVDEFSLDHDEDTTVRKALEDGAAKLVDELRVSLEFYASQEDAAAVDQVIVCGPGSAIPGLTERIEDGLGLTIEPATPMALSKLDEEQAARLTISYGLALEG
jgi:type IV pilus assembly protein PilM